MAQGSDLVVIGGGPGGYVAAIRAAQLGLKVTLVERDNLGGICLNWGCIPTKALLRSAEIKHYMDYADAYGLSSTGVSFDLTKIVERSRKISAQLSSGIQFLLQKNKVTVTKGIAKIKSKGVLTVQKEDKTTEEITYKNLIIATGARAREIPNIKPDGEHIWTSKEAMTPKNLPESLLIIGSGAIGVEFASFYRSMGVQVTIVEMQKNILPQEDEEISSLAYKQFEKQGIKFILNTTVSKATVEKGKVKVVLGDGKEMTVSHVLVAAGVVGNVENLGLEGTKVKVEKNQIVVDDFCRTAEENIYAIGDVAGAPWLAHKASHEGIIAAEHIAGKNPKAMKRSNIPGCTYSNPQIASIGYTEKKCKELGLDVKIGRFPFRGNGKALALGEPDGLVKTIFDKKTGEFLGAHLIGAEVTELIQGLAIAKTLETTEEDLIHTIFPHPTLSEMIHESVLNAEGRAIHIA